jgi:ATP-dependent helicase/DNAse subunit B
MALNLIAGPPNSGRTGAVLDRFRAVLDRDPVLVVPTVDDVERFERELTSGAGAVIGAEICTFERLFALVARDTGAPAGPALSMVQRRRVAREAAAGAELKLLAGSARHTGFATALEELISELQSALIDPGTLSEAAAAVGPYEREIAALYEAYGSVRDELGREDQHTLAATATAALRARPEAWGAKPLLLYGFDDLTAEQLELLLTMVDATDVTVALPWEDRELFTSARGALFAQLRDLRGVTIERLEAEPRFTRSAALFEVERRFGEPADGESLENDGGIALLASAGELAEAESVGGEIARLLADGTAPGQIAIVLRQPEALGPLYRRVLQRFRIPVAVQADLDVSRTLTGAGLIALLEASVGRRRAGDVLAYLRTPGIDSPARVDWFERRLLRGRMADADEAIADWNGGETRRELAEIERLRGTEPGPALLREAARQARWLAEGAQRGEGETAEEDRALELRTGAEIEGALLELAELGLPIGPEELIATVSELTVPLWRGPTAGRVRVISPYRARARRVDHVFVCSLQDGQFPRRDTGGPLLSDESRAALGILPRVRAEVEDRYLFAVALSRAKACLWLSWRDADDEGGATARSPFVDQVRGLLSPALPDDLEQRDEAIAAEAGGRGIAESVFAPGEAPSEDELARALAARRIRPEGNGTELAARLASAAESVTEERRRPGPLRVPAVIKEMEGSNLFGASTLEEFAVCPYRWFVDHELSPRRIEPTETALTAGGVAHSVLERLYQEQPGGSPRPTAATLEGWSTRAGELIEELGAEELPRERRDTAATLRRVEGLVGAFLADEASADLPYVPRPDLAEASFGFDQERPPLEITATAGLHGQIDRVDIGPGGEALIQDYKSGARVEGGKGMLKKGKLQLQLYMLAIRERWGLELAGGLYRPLGATSEREPKGLLRKEAKEDLAPLNPRKFDHLDDDAFEQSLADARARAAEITDQIQAGDIGRRPIDDRCPSYCQFQPICRRERGLPEEEPWTEEDEEE